MRSLKKSLKWAQKRKVALAHFNVSTFEQLKAAAAAAKKNNVPILIGVSEGERNYWGEEEIKSLVDAINKKWGDKKNDAGFWIFLNADHTKDIKKAEKAARVGFDEIIFDASDKSLGENIALTKEAVKRIKKINRNILVEGEVGYIGSSSEVWDKIPQGVSLKNLTTPEEAIEFVKKTGVDIFSPAVGNIHGLYKGGKNPHLDIKRIRAIKQALKIPLVLHGGSGISSKDFILAIKAGINIIHISTELRVLWKESLIKSLRESKKEVAPYKITEKTLQTLFLFIERKIKLFYF